MARTAQAMVNPELLVWARETSGLSLEQAAKKLQVKADRLAAYEQGDAHPTVRQARELARIYRRPFAAFYLPAPPKHFSVPHDFRTISDNESRSLSPELLLEIRRARFQREIAIDVLEEGDTAEFELYGRFSLAQNVENVALKARKALGVDSSGQIEWSSKPYGPFNGWRDAFERSNILVVQMEKVSVEEARGFSISNKKFPIVAVNGKDSISARVFTLFHELGHLLLGEEGICNCDETKQVKSHDQQVERFCNEFAAAALVPKQLLFEVMQLDPKAPHSWSQADIRQPAELFGVSEQVVARRLVSLKQTPFEFFLDVREAAFARAQSKPKDVKTKPTPIPRSTLAVRRVGPAFARLVLNAYDRQQITTGDLVEYLGVRSKHFDKVRELAFKRN